MKAFKERFITGLIFFTYAVLTVMLIQIIMNKFSTGNYKPDYLFSLTYISGCFCVGFFYCYRLLVKTYPLTNKGFQNFAAKMGMFSCISAYGYGIICLMIFAAVSFLLHKQTTAYAYSQSQMILQVVSFAFHQSINGFYHIALQKFALVLMASTSAMAGYTVAHVRQRVLELALMPQES